MASASPSDDVAESEFVPDDGPRTHDAEKVKEVLDLDRARTVQRSMLNFQHRLPHAMKKVMRQKLVSLWCAAHALGGVNWSQLYDLLATCKVNDDGSLSDNLQISADVIGQRQKSEREQRARTNLERARCAEQKEKFSNELTSALHSPPVAELCPALVMLIEQQEEQELRSLADADYGVTDFIEPHLGKEMLTRMVREIKERNDVMMHELSIGEWNNTALNQYRDLAMVWPDRWQTIEGIPTQKVRDWIEGKSAGAAIDGPTWWLVFARRCGYVERDENGVPKLDDEDRTIPLVFDDRFEIDHIIMSSTAHEHKVYLNSGLLDHPDNYMIVYRGPNRHKLFQMSIGKICPLKSYLIGPTNTRHVTNSYQHRFSSLEKNRQALLKAATTVLSKKTREQHLVPYNTSYKANQETNMKRLVSNTASRRDASSLAKKNGQSTLTFATEPLAKRAKVDEGGSSTDDAKASEEEEEEEEEDNPEEEDEVLTDDDDSNGSEEEKWSDITGVDWHKAGNKWRVQTTAKGIHPKNADGEWTVWTNKPREHVGYYTSKAEAEGAYAPEQEKRGKQWCAEVEATKNLPYLPWCRKHIEPPTDWVQGKQYAYIHFGDQGGHVGPVLVTLVKNRTRKDKDGKEHQRWQTIVSRPFKKATKQYFRKPPSTSSQSAAAKQTK